MRRFWLFRSDITALEYYHKFKDLQTFKEKCHDYYMLLPLWFLENNFFDEVIIWRLTKRPIDDIIFDVGGKKYIQRWVSNLKETFDYPSPEISFWRGGFQVYDNVTKVKPKHFGFKLYLGAGRRIYPQWGGKYDIFLMEDERDFIPDKKCLPFYKTASPEIFRPLLINNISWDICWPCNFNQIKYKGQSEFIKMIAQRPVLRKYKIIHCGDKPEIGKKLCRKFGVDNIEFRGLVDRPELNKILNASKFGLNLSNLHDGCPRISTEILMSGTPLFVKDTVRLLNYFKGRGVVEINNINIINRFVWGMSNYNKVKLNILRAVKNELSFDIINQKNIELWKKI